MERLNIAGESLWENIVGYSRAVKIGNTIEISGTTSMEGTVLVGTSVYEQTQFILSKIEKILLGAGAFLNDVVRTRIFITDISKWEEAGKAHGEYFSSVKPCTTMVEVSRLISDDLLVEIEATAILS
jgi:enamine deaminase RidA (YjgF/YER057c/UK114 family)